MAIKLYMMSGSSYAWRVWLALEHKRIPYDLRMLSYDAGDLSNALQRRCAAHVLID